MNTKNLTILQTVAPDYREKFLDYLHSKLKENFILFAGNEYFEESIKTKINKAYLKKIENIFLFNRKFLVQKGMWKEIFNRELVILELNPRVISNWLILISRKLMNKKTILWGHAWPRSGKNSKGDIIRHVMRNLANEIIVYTKTQAEDLKEKMPHKVIKYAPNALYYENEMIVDPNILKPKHIIYVGRLVESKKPLLLLKAFNLIKDKLPKDTRLLIVGDGPEKKQLKKYILENNLNDKVNLLGHINDYNKLKELYHRSVVSVSPGYVGLSITQSFSFGVPMIISKNEPHSPEIEAAIEGFNSLFFDTDNIEDLSQKILEFYNNKNWISPRKRYEICEFCKKNYSIEKMAKPFLELI